MSTSWMDGMNSNFFSTIRTTVEARNMTTGVIFRHAIPTSICEFSDKQIILEAPNKACARNHHLLLDVKSEVPGEGATISFSATVKVLNVEDSGDGTDRITTQLMQFKSSEFQKFVDLYQERQNQVHAFVQMAKGIDSGLLPEVLVEENP